MSVGKVKKEAIFYKWTIPNFTATFENLAHGQGLDSPAFDDWRIKLFPKGYKHHSKDYMSIFLTRRSDETVKADFCFSILGENNKKIKERFSYNKLFDSNDSKSRNTWGGVNWFKTKIAMDLRNGLLVDDCLTIQCEIYLDGGLNFLIEQLKQQFKIPIYQARLKEFDDFEKTLDDIESSNVKFEISDEVICAHKAILMARSPVFAAMFTHDMLEKDQNTVRIEDIEPAVFKEMLRFIYAGKVNNIDIMTEELLIAANKYSIAGLMKLCEDTLAERVSVDNVLSTIQLADLHNAANLKTVAMNFIKSHPADVVDVPSFKDFGKRNFDLMYEITCEIARDHSVTRESKIRKLE